MQNTKSNNSRIHRYHPIKHHYKLPFDTYLSDVTKEYNDMFKVVVFVGPIEYSKFYKIKTKQDKEEEKERKQEDNIQRSVRRSRSMISDYVLCNDFDWFVTFTFSPKKVNRYDLNEVYIKMQGWLWRTSRKYSDFKYIIVPERHKDGAIHFHAVISGYNGAISPTKVVQDGRRVYSLPGFRFGITNATKLDDDKSKVVAYICKYLTKDMVLISGRRRYWASKNLNKPIVRHNAIHDLGIASFIKPKNLSYQTQYNAIYEIPKKDLLLQ